MAPSVTPSRTGVCIHGRYRIHARRRIERIFIKHHRRRRYNDRPATTTVSETMGAGSSPTTGGAVRYSYG